MKRPVIRELAAMVLLAALGVGYFWPLVGEPASRISDNYDGLFISWVLSSVGENITSSKPLFEGDIFYPAEDTLAFSDIFITDTLLTLPIKQLTGEPVAQFNVALIFSQVVMLLAVYWLVHELTNDRFLGTSVALVYGFSAIRLHYVMHLQMMSIYWIPLSWLALVKVEKHHSKAWAGVWFVCFLLQSLNSFLPGMMVLFSSGVFLFRDEVRTFIRANRAVMGMLTVLVTVPIGWVAWHYLAVSARYDYVRSIRDVMHFSASIHDLWGVFWSPSVWLLGVTALAVWWRGRRADRLCTFASIGLMGLVLSLGPALKWAGESVKIPFHIPLPYALLYFVVPGFKGFRTPSRWVALMALGLAVAGAVALLRLPKKKAYIVSGLLVLLTFLTVPPLRTVPVKPLSAPAPVYEWLKEQPGGVVIELPMRTSGTEEVSRREVERMLYQRLHGKKLVNGYSGFSPPEWKELVVYLAQEFPSEPSINRLNELGVDYMIVHLDEYQAPARMREFIKSNQYWLPIERFGETYVFTLTH